MKTIKDTCYKGTVIRLGNEKRDLIDQMISYVKNYGFQEIQIPIIQFQETFQGKVGAENNNLMFNFQDRAERKICLAPEYTAVIQRLAKTAFKQEKDVKLFYVAECFRGERQQRGRWRQFTQFGVEVLNPEEDAWYDRLVTMSAQLTGQHFALRGLQVDENIPRGLDYYIGGRGWEIRGDGLQLCGGGEYENGIGFAIGVDRLLITD